MHNKSAVNFFPFFPLFFFCPLDLAYFFEKGNLIIRMHKDNACNKIPRFLSLGKKLVYLMTLVFF